jgi:hypothetical protein
VFEKMETLVCTVKSATPDGARTTCSVFMLALPVDFVGTVLLQYKDAVKVGSWRVEAYGKELVLARMDGSSDLEQCDYLFGEVKVSEPPPPSRTQIGFYLVFEGKNWKLAAEKKWREKQVDIAGFEHVGDTRIKGKPFKILKGPEFFAAVPAPPTEPDTPPV